MVSMDGAANSSNPLVDIRNEICIMESISEKCDVNMRGKDMQKRKCVDCGKEFTLSDSEEKFYKDKNLALPKRCKECRDRRKQQKRNDFKPQRRGESESDKPISQNETRRPTSAVGKIIAAVAAAVLIIYTVLSGQLPGLLANWNSDSPTDTTQQSSSAAAYTFRSEELLEEHFRKHGSEFPYDTKEAYEAGASAVIRSPEALKKKEAEDGDDVYYIEKSNEFVILSTDGYIRTYFRPEGGIDYYNRQ